MRKEKKPKEVFEFGIGNAECGKKKSRKRAEATEFGMRRGLKLSYQEFVSKKRRIYDKRFPSLV
jgi:hypothetical protein